MTVADMPSLEVESSPADLACCKTCSKDHAAHGKGGVFYCPLPINLHFQAHPAGNAFPPFLGGYAFDKQYGIGRPPSPPRSGGEGRGKVVLNCRIPKLKAAYGQKSPLRSLRDTLSPLGRGEGTNPLYVKGIIPLVFRLPKGAQNSG